MDMILLVRITKKIRRLKRIETELNQLMPYFNTAIHINNIKIAINTLNLTQKKMSKDIEFECNICHNIVERGKCVGCKKNYLK